MSHTTYLAMRAVMLRHTCGPFAARQYAAKHGVLSLYVRALQLEVANAAGFGE